MNWVDFGGRTVDNPFNLARNRMIWRGGEGSVREKRDWSAGGREQGIDGVERGAGSITSNGLKQAFYLGHNASSERLATRLFRSFLLSHSSMSGLDDMAIYFAG